MRAISRGDWMSFRIVRLPGKPFTSQKSFQLRGGLAPNFALS